MASKLWWMIHKDLIVEYRSRHAWPAMLVLGVLVAAVFSLQFELPAQYRSAVAGTLLWLAILFAGLVVIERSSAAEQTDGCWEGLLQYPLPPAMIYLAKLLTNLIALVVLECVLVPLFVILADVPFLRHAWPIVLVALPASLGIAAVGTLVAAVSHGLRQQGAVLTVLVLPLLVPLILVASETTCLIAEGNLGEKWWRGIQFLGGYAIVFLTVGITLFGFLIEE